MAAPRCCGPCSRNGCAGHQGDVVFQRPETSDHQFLLLEFVTVSADPLSDSSASLQAYGKADGADLSRWHWLTFSQKQVHALIDALTRRDSAAKPEEHLTSLLMINADGRRIGRAHCLQVDGPCLLPEPQGMAVRHGLRHVHGTEFCLRRCR